MRNVLAALLACALALLPNPTQAGPAPSLSARNVVVLKPGEPHPRPAGGGVLLTPVLIITAAHVVHMTIVQVRCGEELIPAVVRKIDFEIDLALLETTTPCRNVAITALAEDNPEVGDTVRNVGCPEGYCGRVGAGIVADYDHGMIVTDAKTWFGSSGGGLFTPEGRLLGICSKISVVTELHEHDRGGKPVQEPFGNVWGLYVPVNIVRAFVLLAALEAQQHGPE